MNVNALGGAIALQGKGKTNGSEISLLGTEAPQDCSLQCELGHLLALQRLF